MNSSKPVKQDEGLPDRPNSSLPPPAATVVTLPGRILYKDTHAYLSLGDVAVAPKMSATEGSGKIPLYMSMALPTITFDTPVSREYLADTGIYAQFGSAEDLAAKLRIALEQPAWAAGLGWAARERAVRELSWDQAARQVEAIYAEVLGQRATNDERRDRAVRAGDETEEAVERGA